MKAGVAALAALAGALAGCGGSCNVPPTPQSDTCELAPGAPQPTVSAVRVGRRTATGFQPIVAESVVPTVVGGQGSDMFVVALAIEGAGLSDCIAQETVLETVGGDLISSEEAPLAATTDGATATTGDVFLPYYGPYGGHVRIRATVAGVSDEVTFWADELGMVDAARPDAPVDATPTDAAPPDAAPTDAAPDA